MILRWSPRCSTSADVLLRAATLHGVLAASPRSSRSSAPSGSAGVAPSVQLVVVSGGAVLPRRGGCTPRGASCAPLAVAGSAPVHRKISTLAGLPRGASCSRWRGGAEGSPQLLRPGGRLTSC
ncbi:hypothetical protein QJS66_12090 [Kocuria rhizophila]|nr:hypothetical protein QJS66_12090 [Kocuria rhizophila]